MSAGYQDDGRGSGPMACPECAKLNCIGKSLWMPCGTMTSAKGDGRGEMIECDHTFAEEREPSGRLILTPCLSCGMSAMDAMSALKAELAAAREETRIALQLYSDECDEIAKLRAALAEKEKEAKALSGTLAKFTGDNAALRKLCVKLADALCEFNEHDSYTEAMGDLVDRGRSIEKGETK